MMEPSAKSAVVIVPSKIFADVTEPSANLTVIIVILTACWMVWGLTKTIKTEGGHCTANPLAYSEHKIKDSFGKTVICSCKENTMDIGWEEVDGLTYR